MGEISWVDWIIWGVYLTFAFLLLWMYRNSKKDAYYRYYLAGFLIKVVGGVGFALIYVYYYKYGDTFLYHRGASILSQTFIDSPMDYFRLLFSNSGELPADLGDIAQRVAYSKTYEEWFMVKILSPVSLVSFQSYLVTTLLVSFISFFGGWKLMKVFRDILPERETFAFLAAFIVPSVFFWGGGLMKDTITMACLSYIIYALYFFVVKGEKSILKVVGILICSFLIFKLKSYILIAFLPTILFTIYFNFLSKISTSFIRWIVQPILLLTVTIFIVFSLQNLTTLSQKYDVSRIESNVQGFHSWHTTQGGSVYNLGETDFTFFGIISKVPAALNATFFRPYFWESRSFVLVFGALESGLVLYLFLAVLWRSRLRPYKYLKNNPLLKALLFFILIFGFAIGFTTYNFGALARYKIPVMPCFVFILLFVYHKSSKRMKLEE